VGTDPRTLRRPVRAEPLAQEQETDQGLGVPAILDHVVEVGERVTLDLDPLARLGLGVGIGQVGGQIEGDPLVRVAGSGVEGREELPVGGGLADLLGQLALGGLQGRLALDVQLARRELKEVGLARGLARLADQPDLPAVVGDDADAEPGWRTTSRWTTVPSAWR
jgi:hypothetical protein